MLVVDSSVCIDYFNGTPNPTRAALRKLLGDGDLRIVVQGTGHGAGVHAPLDGAMLVNMREMRRVEIGWRAGRRREDGVLGVRALACGRVDVRPPS